MPQQPRKGPRDKSAKKPQVVITVFGCWPDYTRQGIKRTIMQCQRTMNQYQWKMTRSLQKNTTHVILTKSWYDRLDDRFQLVDKSSFKKLEWLLDCAAQGELLCGENPKHCWFLDAIPKTANLTAARIEEQMTHTKDAEVVQQSGKEYKVTLQQARRRNDQERMRIYNMKIERSGNQFQLITEWGWLGRTPTPRDRGKPVVASSEAEAVAVFRKKFHDKTKLNWSDIPKTPVHSRSFQVAPHPLTPGLSASVQELVRFIFDESLVEDLLDKYGYHWKVLAVDQLTDHTILESFKILKSWQARLREVKKFEKENLRTELKAEIKKINRLCEEYCCMIPHKFTGGVRLGFDGGSFRKEAKLLGTIQRIRTTSLMPPCSVLEKENLLDWQYDKLGLKIESLGTQSTLLELYKRSVEESWSHYYEVKEIFRLKDKGENDNRHVKNRLLLWHGSRSITIASILSQGFRVPHSDTTLLKGKFGNGIYFADTASFATEFCKSHHSDGQALLLLCEVALGEALHCTAEDVGATFDPKKRLGGDFDSTLGRGERGPRIDVEDDWRDAKFIDENLRGIRVPWKYPRSSSLDDLLSLNEYVCYDQWRVNPRYLFWLKVSGWETD